MLNSAALKGYVGQNVASASNSAAVLNPGITDNVMEISQIVKSVKADIAHLKSQLESIPPFPEGKSIISK